MFILLLLWSEIITFFVVAIWHVIKFLKFWKHGIKVKQISIWGHGQILALIGVLAGIGIPKVIGLQGDLSYVSQEIYFVVTSISTCIFMIGLRFMIASYCEEDKVPKWIRKISDFWK